MRDRYQHADDQPRRRKRERGVRISRTHIGLGVFARQRYQPDEIVGEIEGTVIDDLNYSSNYCMDMGGAHCLEPGPPFRFVNHSCEPNCFFQCYDVVSPTERTPRRRVFLVTYDPIEPGEQLTIDYGWPPNMAIRCRCGAPTCRGWIVASDQLAEVVAGAAGTTECEAERCA